MTNRNGGILLLRRSSSFMATHIPPSARNLTFNSLVTLPEGNSPLRRMKRCRNDSFLSMPEAVIAARFFPLAHPEQALVKSRTPEELAADVAKFVTLLPKIGVTSFLVGQATDKNKTLREQVIDLVTFFIVLQNLQRTCAEWRAPPYDQAKRLCAGRALGLLQDLSTKLPTSGSAR